MSLRHSIPSGELNNVTTLTAGVLVGLVLAVGLAVTEELLVDALAVAARQLPLRANGLVGLEDGQDFARLCKTRTIGRVIGMIGIS